MYVSLDVVVHLLFNSSYWFFSYNELHHLKFIFCELLVIRWVGIVVMLDALVTCFIQLWTKEIWGRFSISQVHTFSLKMIHFYFWFVFIRRWVTTVLGHLNKMALLFMNHARIRSFNQPVLCDKANGFCCGKWWELLVGLELNSDRPSSEYTYDALTR